MKPFKKKKDNQPAGTLKIDVLVAFKIGNINIEMRKGECAMPANLDPNDACQKIALQLLAESGYQIGWKWFEPKEALPGGINQVKITGPAEQEAQG